MGLIRDKILLFALHSGSDIGNHRRKAAVFAQELGFPRGDSEEIAILATEMMTNVLDHGAAEGCLVLCRVQNNEGRHGVEIWAMDNGSGIKNFDQASRDGYSSKNSLGFGLGTIRRFSDEIETGIKEVPAEFKNQEGFKLMQGLVICSRKWLSQPGASMRNKHIEIGAASRPKPGERINGDCFLIHHLSCTETLAAVIDGLGHGSEAHEASRLAVKSIKAKATLPLPEIIKYTHETLLGTRGATIGAALIKTDSNKISFLGMGNIEARVVTAQKKHALISLGGIVGLKIRTPRVYDHIYETDNFLVLYSDGINSGWQNDYENWDKHPQQIAEDILDNFAKYHDDATILIIKLASANS